MLRRIWQALGWLTAIVLASFVWAFAFWWLAGGGGVALKALAVTAYLALYTTVVFVFPIVVVAGLPLVLLCRLFGWTGPIAAVVVGSLIGAAGFFVFAPFFGDTPVRHSLSADTIESAVRAGICGVLGGLAFWATLRFWPKVSSRA